MNIITNLTEEKKGIILTKHATILFKNGISWNGFFYDFYDSKELWSKFQCRFILRSQAIEFHKEELAGVQNIDRSTIVDLKEVYNIVLI